MSRPKARILSRPSPCMLIRVLSDDCEFEPKSLGAVHKVCHAIFDDF